MHSFSLNALVSTPAVLGNGTERHEVDRGK
jgi:hypothetical protein